MGKITTIQLSRDIAEKLRRLKVHPREPYGSVIARLIDNSFDDEPLSEEEIRSIKKSIEDVKKGRTYSLEEVKKELGV